MQKTIRKPGKLALAFDKAFTWPILLSLSLLLLFSLSIASDNDLVTMLNQVKLSSDLKLQLICMFGTLSGLFFTVFWSFVYFVYLLIVEFRASRKEVPGNE